MTATMMEQPLAANRWKRRAKSAVTAIGVIVLVFYGAGGWYFSNLLRADGLQPEPPTRDFDVVVLGLDESTITLAGADEAISKPGRYGLWWEAGYVQVGDVVEVRADDSVVRELIPIDGNPPISTGPDDPDRVEVDLESFAYGHPDHLGLPSSDVTYQSPLGDMSAWLVTPVREQADDTWAIHVHGWRADRRETLRALPAFAAAGVTSLVIDYRNDAGAPADPTGHYRFGRSEWQDVQGAIDYATANGARRILLVGYSTGAAAVMATMEQAADVDPVVGLVFDSPNIDFGRAVKTEAARRTIPGTPIPIPNTLTLVAMTIADWRWDIAWDHINYVSRAGDIDIPMLVFQGSADETVPPSVARDLAAANPARISLVETTAGHVESWNVDPDAYGARIRDFLVGVID